MLIPFLVYALAALGLNLLTGYAGQLSLGTGGFMAVGAYSAFKLATAFPRLNIIVVFLLAGVVAAAVGILFGIPSLRIKGFYLAVATLAAQFFLIWLFNKVAWFTNYASSGTITAPDRTLFGVLVTGPNSTPAARYLTALGLVAVFALAAKNLVRGPHRAVVDGDPRSRHRRRDHRRAPAAHEAARLRHQLVLLRGGRGRAGVPLPRQRRDARVRHRHLVPGPVHGDHRRPRQHPRLVPRRRVHRAGADRARATRRTPIGLRLPVALQKQIELMVFGGLIIFFLIVEPRGLARLWQITKEKLRLWPFPH